MTYKNHEIFIESWEFEPGSQGVKTTRVKAHVSFLEDTTGRICYTSPAVESREDAIADAKTWISN